MSKTAADIGIRLQPEDKGYRDYLSGSSDPRD